MEKNVTFHTARWWAAGHWAREICCGSWNMQLVQGNRGHLDKISVDFWQLGKFASEILLLFPLKTRRSDIFLGNNILYSKLPTAPSPAWRCNPQILLWNWRGVLLASKTFWLSQITLISCLTSEQKAELLAAASQVIKKKQASLQSGHWSISQCCWHYVAGFEGLDECPSPL